MPVLPTQTPLRRVLTPKRVALGIAALVLPLTGCNQLRAERALVVQPRVVIHADALPRVATVASVSDYD